MQDSTWVSIGALVVSALAVVSSYLWNYKTRALPHREFLYQKQIEAYVEISTYVTQYLSPCYIFFDNNKITAENRQELNAFINKAIEELRNEYRKTMVIVPTDVSMQIFSLLKLLDDIRNLETDKLSLDAGKLRDSLWGAEIHVKRALREKAGIEPLTKEMLGTFGR